MVEGELKASRPGSEFRAQVLRRVTEVRAKIQGPESGLIQLSDSEGRALSIGIGHHETRAIKPWLKEPHPKDASDLHSALVNTLARLDRKLNRVVVSDLVAGTFYATVEVSARSRIAKVDSRPSDALNFAVRAGVPIFVNKEMMDTYHLKRKDGKPMSPSSAWRMPQVPSIPLRPISIVLRDLERKNPEDKLTRRQLFNATSSFIARPPWIVAREPAIREMRSWLERKKGTPLEGFANGILGAVYAWTQQPKEAIPYLERAHELLPQDARVGFDLATAYLMIGKREAALSTISSLDEMHLKMARDCGNFYALWRRKKFRSVVGASDKTGKHLFVSAQIGVGSGIIGIKKFPTVIVDKKLPKRARQAARLREISKPSLAQAEKLTGAAPLVAVQQVLGPCRKSKKEQWLVFEIAGKAAAVRLNEVDAAAIRSAFRRYPRPLTATTIGNVLKAASVRLDAIVLQKDKRTHIKAQLVAGADSKEVAVPVDVIPGVAVAIACASPLLLDQALAEKLYVRGKDGKPVTLHGAERSLGIKVASQPPVETWRQVACVREKP